MGKRRPLLRNSASKINPANNNVADELAYAFYCANVSPEKEAITPYKRKKYSKLSTQASMSVYHRKHIQKLVQMVVKVVGANPHGWMANMAGAFLWHRLQSKTA